MPLDVECIKERIAILQKHDPLCEKVFGAELHRNKPNPPLSEAEVLAFEQQHGITLPEDYRTFLLKIGNGGVGPGYGLYRMEEWDNPWGWLDEHPEPKKFLCTPFPYSVAWNPINEVDPDKEWYKKAIENLPANATPSERQRLIQLAYQEFVEEKVGRKYYRSSSHVTGTMTINQWGSGWEDSLVVTGPMKGTIWTDARGFGEGIYPFVDELNGLSSPPLTFAQWYCRWLRDAAETVVQGHWLEVDKRRRDKGKGLPVKTSTVSEPTVYSLISQEPPEKKPQGFKGFLSSLFR